MREEIKFNYEKVLRMYFNKNIYKNKYLVIVEDIDGNTFLINKDGKVDLDWRCDLDKFLYNEDELKDYNFYNNCIIEECKRDWEGAASWREVYEWFRKEIYEVKVEDIIEDNLSDILECYNVEDINKFEEKINNIKLFIKKVISEELLMKNNYSKVNNLKYKINNFIIEEFNLKSDYCCDSSVERILEVLLK